MLNPELYTRQFEDSACIFINVTYDNEFFNHIEGKQKLFKVYSSLCANFPYVKDDSSTCFLAFSLRSLENNRKSPTALATGREAWTEIQSFRRSSATINLLLKYHSIESNSDHQKKHLSSVDQDTLKEVRGQQNERGVSADKTTAAFRNHFDLYVSAVAVDQSPCIENGSGDKQDLDAMTVFDMNKASYENKAHLRDWLLSVVQSVNQLRANIENIVELSNQSADVYCRLLKKITPLTAEKEAKQQIGVTIQNAREKYKGRCLKHWADLMLQLNKITIATELFKKATENLSIAKDWTWYAAALEGSITCHYLVTLPTERQTTFYDRVYAHQTGLLFSEDKLNLADPMKQLLDHEKAILNHYDKSADTKFMLREFKYKILLVKFSYGILKSKQDGVILDESFRLFPELKDKNSPKRAPQVKDLSLYSAEADVRKCLAAVKLLVFKEQTRKAAYILLELVGGDVSLDYFRDNPLSAIIYLVHIMPVYGINIQDAFVHRAMQRGKFYWRELQLHIVELILYYLELLQQNQEFSNIATSLITWFNCFKLNTFYQMLSQKDIETLLSSINLKDDDSLTSGSKITLNVLEFPPIVFTNIPFLRSVNVLKPYERQLHLHPKASEPNSTSQLFEFQSVQLEKQQAKKYTWPASSSIVVQLVFSNSLRSQDSLLTLDVELVVSGVAVTVEKRRVRILPQSVESVNFEVSLVEPGEITIEGYKIFWEEMSYTSSVLFNQHSKFITKHSFHIPYLECFWYPDNCNRRISLSSNVAQPLVSSTSARSYITKDTLLEQELYYGTTKTLSAHITALRDIENYEVTTISKYGNMFSVAQEKKTISKEESSSIVFLLNASDVNLDKWGLTEPSDFQSFVKISIESLTIPFFSLKMKVLPSVMIQSIELMPANRAETFNLCLTLRNLTDFECIISVFEAEREIKAQSVKRTIFLMPKFDPASFNLEDRGRSFVYESSKQTALCDSKNCLSQLFQKLSLTWTSAENVELQGKIYIPNCLFSNFNIDKFDICLNYVIPVTVDSFSGAEIEKFKIKCTSGEAFSLDLCFDLSNLRSRADRSILHKTVILPTGNLVEKSEDCSTMLPNILGFDEQEIDLNSLNGLNCFLTKLQILPILPGEFSLQFHFGAQHKTRVFVIEVHRTERDLENYELVNFLSDNEDDNNNTDYVDQNS